MKSKALNPGDQRSLVLGVDDAAPGALCALTVIAGVVVAPENGLAVRFGRNRPDVEVCVGEDDLSISRQHGLIDCRKGNWWVTNVGRSPIRLPNSLMLHPQGESIPLASGYTPMFLRGTRGREHLLELYVAGAEGGRPLSRAGEVTLPPKRWRLSPEERHVLIVAGQRYLLHDPHPQPLSREQTAIQLEELQPDAGWTIKRVEHVLRAVRLRLSAAGVYGLRRDEVGEPVGVTLTVNLMRELVSSTTLVPLDLELLENHLDDT